MELLHELLAARERRVPCALVTVAATRGSVPREAGAKMIVYDSGETCGTIGGGKFESLVIEASLAALSGNVPVLKTYPLHEADAESFGAICGGEVTVLIEPQGIREAIYVVGAGHCAQAIARLAHECGLHVTVIDDRAELLEAFPGAEMKVNRPAPDFIASRKWRGNEAIVLVSRNYAIDREALATAIRQDAAGYIGMIGSIRKVRRVFDELKAAGVTDEELARVYAPIGFDIGADSPTEIAVSVIAEILQVLRNRSGASLRILRMKPDHP